ncbi:hypothetical protein FPZ41_41990 [Streptomyces sp. K1PN6]|uniref:Uncharacterized protein n=1 Tax=Streptomyces acidicola TaxID=2596892 RepID=A0A5N8X5M0_9ACTN|nr:hypothetical protein [Streptomyces acidicola]
MPSGRSGGSIRSRRGSRSRCVRGGAGLVFAPAAPTRPIPSLGAPPPAPPPSGASPQTLFGGRPPGPRSSNAGGAGMCGRGRDLPAEDFQPRPGTPSPSGV